MTEVAPIFVGEVIPAKTFAAEQASVREAAQAQSDAARILEDAHAEAARIVEAAQARADDMDRDLQAVADAQLAKFADERAVDEMAIAVQAVLQTGIELRRDFDAFTPWMRSFVVQAVERITGTLPAEMLWSGLIHKSLVDIRDRWNLVILCHPERVTLLTEIIAVDAALSDAVKGVQPNRDLGLDECLIQSANGMTDISLKTQLVTLMLALEKLAEDADGAGA